VTDVPLFTRLRLPVHQPDLTAEAIGLGDTIVRCTRIKLTIGIVSEDIHALLDIKLAGVLTTKARLQGSRCAGGELVADQHGVVAVEGAALHAPEQHQGKAKVDVKDSHDDLRVLTDGPEHKPFNA